MDIVVVGAGAVGGALAGYLSAAGHTVVALDEWPAHVTNINRDGLLVAGARGTHRFLLNAALWADSASIEVTPGLVFVCVKSYDTVRAAELIAPLLGPDTTVVSTQNGMNEGALGELLGPRRIVGCVTEIGGYIVGPGEIAETRADGGFVIGELDGSDSPRLRCVQEVLSGCAPTAITSTIRGLLWSKLTWNCMMNPLTALTGLGQGEIWTTPGLPEIAEQIGREVRDVADADGAMLEPLTFLGVDLPALLADDEKRSADARRHVIDLYVPQVGKSTSMREDVKHGRRTEISFLNGHVADRGEQLGVPVALNREIVRLVQSVESGVSSPSLRLVESLVSFAKLETELR